mgnify:CR=1 FL=1
MGAEKLNKKADRELGGRNFPDSGSSSMRDPSTGAGILFSCMDLRDSVFRSKFLFLE